MNWFSRAYDSVEAWLLERGFSVASYSNSLHLYGSFMIIVVLVASGIGVWSSAGIALICGFMKEIFDWKVRGTEFSWADIGCDCIGILAGILFCGGVRLV